jgi:hypothetical protein
MKKLRNIAVVIMICIQFIYMFYWGLQKGGYYVDEFFTYDNTHYISASTPDRVKLYDSGLIKYEKWTDLVELKSTLMVQKDESLYQDSLFYNIKMLSQWDLYTCILNYVEAFFFEGELNWWSAISINLICFIINQILIYLIVMKLTSKSNTALLAVALYGFSGMAVSMLVYVRFYTCAITLITLFTYLHVLMWNSENHVKNIILEVIALPILYLAYRMSPLCAVYCVAMIFCFSIGVLIIRKWKQVLYYIIPFIGGGYCYAFFMTNYIQIMLDPKQALEVGTLDSATTSLVQGAVSLNPSNFMERLVELLHIIIRYLFGHAVVVAVYIVVILAVAVVCIYNVLKQNKIANDVAENINKMVYLIGSTILIYAIASIIFNLRSIRYNSFIFPEIAIIVVTVIMGLSREKKSTYIVIALLSIAVIGEIYFTCSIPRIENLYADEKDELQVLSEYKGIDSVVMDYKFDDKVMYECLAYADDGTRVMFTYYGNTDYSNLPDTFLFWQTVNESFDIHDDLELAGYYYLEEIAQTHESKIYYCSK